MDNNQRIKFLKDAEISIAESTKIVDVGCGMGRFVCFLISKGMKNAFGVDLKDVIEVSKKEEGNKEIQENLLYGKGEELPFKDNELDVVIFDKSFHHSNQKNALIEVERCLKKNGKALYIEPVFNFDQEDDSSIFLSFMNFKGNHHNHHHHHHHHNHNHQHSNKDQGKEHGEEESEQKKNIKKLQGMHDFDGALELLEKGTNGLKLVFKKEYKSYCKVQEFIDQHKDMMKGKINEEWSKKCHAYAKKIGQKKNEKNPNFFQVFKVFVHQKK